MFPRPINPTLFVEKADVWKVDVAGLADASLADLLAIERMDALNILQLWVCYFNCEQVFVFLVASRGGGKGAQTCRDEKASSPFFIHLHSSSFFFFFSIYLDNIMMNDVNI